LKAVDEDYLDVTWTVLKVRALLQLRRRAQMGL